MKPDNTDTRPSTSSPTDRSRTSLMPETGPRGIRADHRATFVTDSPRFLQLRPPRENRNTDSVRPRPALSLEYSGQLSRPGESPSSRRRRWGFDAVHGLLTPAAHGLSRPNPLHLSASRRLHLSCIINPTVTDRPGSSGRSRRRSRTSRKGDIGPRRKPRRPSAPRIAPTNHPRRTPDEGFRHAKRSDAGESDRRRRQGHRGSSRRSFSRNELLRRFT